MEKYLRGLEENLYNQDPNLIRTPNGFDGNNNQHFAIEDGTETGPQLSKWLESAANFTPSKNSYIEWCARYSNIPLTRLIQFQFRVFFVFFRNTTERLTQKNATEDLSCPLLQMSIHQKEEIEAAEALTKLALNFRSRYSR